MKSVSSARSAERRYGRQGGGWAPYLAPGEAPFGVIEGERQPCPEPARTVCGFCGLAAWVAATRTGEPCHMCGGPLVVEEEGAR